MVKRRLKDIADLQISYQARAAIEHDPLGTHRVLQAKDISSLEGFDPEGLMMITPERGWEKYLVSKGDVLLASRGARNYAYAISVPLVDTIAAGSLYILRPLAQVVLPKYLAWFINQPQTQAALRDMATGATITIVRKPVLEALEVAIPSIEIQEKVTRLDDLLRKEHHLTRGLMEKRQQLVQMVCAKAIETEGR